MLFSCKRAEPGPGVSQIIIKEGETESLEVDGEMTPVKLVGVNVLFNEGIVEEKVTTFYRVYKAIVSIGSDTLQFHTSFYRINDEPFKEKSWEDLSKRYEIDIKTYKSYQIGISNIKAEKNSGSSPGYVVKLLIKK